MTALPGDSLLCCQAVCFQDSLYTCSRLKLLSNNSLELQSRALTQKFEFSQYSFKDIKVKQSTFICKEMKAVLDVEISEGLFTPLDPAESPYV